MDPGREGPVCVLFCVQEEERVWYVEPFILKDVFLRFSVLDFQCKKAPFAD